MTESTENTPVEGVVDDTQEESSKEEDELDYSDAFDAQWGDGKDAEPAKPKAEVEDPEPEPEVTEPETQESEQGSAQAKDTSDSDEDVDDQYAWIDSLPSEVRAKAERLKHSAKADSGRVASYNKKLRELRQEMDAMRSRPDKQEPATSDASASESAVHELPKEFEQLKEDFPEFASAVDALREYDRQQFERQLEAKLKPLEQDRVQQQQDAFNQQVSSAAEKIFNTKETGTDWKEVVASDDFASWLELQPRSVQTAARTPDPEEAIFVLRQYESDYQAAVALMEEPTKSKDVSTNSTQPNKADALKQQRQRRKVDSVAPGSKPVIADKAGGGGDYETEFNARWG